MVVAVAISIRGFNPHLIADVKCAAALPTHLEPRAFRHIFFGLAVSCAYVS